MNDVLKPGTRVLVNGEIGHATPDRRIGGPWDGTYRVRFVNKIFNFPYVTLGWRRSQLTPCPATEV